MKRLLAPLLLCLGLLAPVVGRAADFDTPVTLGPRTVMLTSVELIRTQTDNKGKIETRAKVRFRDTITPTAQGFHVVRQSLDRQLSGLASADMLLLYADRLEFDANATLMPYAIGDWPDVLQRAYANFPPSSSPLLIKDSVAQFSKAPSEQVARNLLSYDNTLAIMQGGSWTLGEAGDYSNLTPNPWGGQPIKVNGVATLDSVDRKAGVAVIHMRESLDAESARAAIMAMLKDLSARTGRALAFNDFSIERTTDCRFEMDLASGLTRKADCETRTRVVTDRPGDTVERSDRRIIVRTLDKAA